jgi:hypothetical protein
VHLLVILSPINCHMMHGVRHKIESLLGSLQVILTVWSLCIRVLCTTLQKKKKKKNPTDGDGRLWVLLRTLCYSSGFGLRMTLKGWSLQSNVVFSFRLAPFHYKNVVECNAFLLIGAEDSYNRPCNWCGERRPIVLVTTCVLCLK